MTDDEYYEMRLKENNLNPNEEERIKNGKLIIIQRQQALKKQRKIEEFALLKKLSFIAAGLVIAGGIIISIPKTKQTKQITYGEFLYSTYVSEQQELGLPISEDTYSNYVKVNGDSLRLYYDETIKNGQTPSAEDYYNDTNSLARGSK